MPEDTRGGHRWDRHRELVRTIERFTMKHGEMPTMADLVAALKVTTQAMAVRLKRAHAAGVVSRRAGFTEDGRPVRRWYATAAGKELL